MTARMLREERLRLWCAERAVDRMHGMDRKFCLAIRFEELSYSQIAARFYIRFADVEKHFAASLSIMMKAMDEKDPWWWRFLP